MDKLSLQLYELLWRNKCCILYKNKNRDYELKILHNKIQQTPYLLRCLIYIIKEYLKQYTFTCILSTDKNCNTINSILGYELNIPVYTSNCEIKDEIPIQIRFSITKPPTNIDYTMIVLFDMLPFKIKDHDKLYNNLYHVYELLDFADKNDFIKETEWELAQLYYYDKIPFEYRSISKKDIQNRNIAITKCYNLLFKKKSNLILDCSGLDAIRILKVIAEYGDYFFLVIIDTDCFTTFTKKHRECFVTCCKEKSLLIYDRLRIEKMKSQQITRIIEKKIGKLDWLHGVFLYSFSEEILRFFKESYPNLGIFFENNELETNKEQYTQLQKYITQVIGIQLQDKRKDWHIDSRVFYLKQQVNSLETIKNKSLTHCILFDNYDFISLQVDKIIGCNLSLLKGIQTKSWSLFKNKF